MLESEAVATELLRKRWKSVLVLFSSVCFLSLQHVFIHIASPGGHRLLSGWQEKSLGCSVDTLTGGCKELLNSRVHKGQLMIKALV